MRHDRHAAALFVLVALIGQTAAVAISLCSSENTAVGSGTTYVYQSDGHCSDQCRSTSAFAITQGSYCWCSNFAPGSTVDNDSCSNKCPGYPYEYCGGPGGLFSYIQLDKQPSGTQGGSAPTTTTAPSSSSRSPQTSSPATIDTSTPSTTSETITQTSSSLITSIVTLPGQTSTIIITPTPQPATGLPTSSGSHNGHGLGKGQVAGLAVGVALGVAVIAGLVLFFLWKRFKQREAEAEAAVMTPEMASAHGGTPSSVSRHTSQMSHSGLLGRPSRINTRNLTNNSFGNGQSAAPSNVSPGSGNRRSLGADQRLDPYSAIYTNEDLRHSDVSLQDNTDYSRKILSVRNRAPGEVDDE